MSRGFLPVLNKLGHYIFKRMCKEQKEFRKNKPMNTYGLYVQPKDIQRYIDDYINYGVDYTCLLYTSPSPRD